MVYTKDLLAERKKSKFAVILGVTSIVIAIVWVLLRIFDNKPITAFDWLFAVVFFMNGVSNTMTGLGYSIERFLGRAYIHIDNDVIILKTGVFEKQQRINWSDIRSIHYKPKQFTFTKPDNSVYKLKITNLDYVVIQEVKDAIRGIADKKRISTTIN